MNAPDAKRVSDPAVRSSGVSLHDFLTRLIWLSVLPLLLLAAWLAFDSVRSIQEQRDLEAENMAQNFATGIDNNLRSRIAALRMLSLSPELADRSRWNILYQNAQAFNRSFGSHVILADAGRPGIFSHAFSVRDVAADNSETCRASGSNDRHRDRSARSR